MPLQYRSGNQKTSEHHQATPSMPPVLYSSGQTRGLSGVLTSQFLQYRWIRELQISSLCGFTSIRFLRTDGGHCDQKVRGAGLPSFPALATKLLHNTKCSSVLMWRVALSRFKAPLAFACMTLFHASPLWLVMSLSARLIARWNTPPTGAMLSASWTIFSASSGMPTSSVVTRNCSASKH